MNGERRHLTPSQRAAIAVEMLGPLKEEAKKRQIANLRQGDECPVAPDLAQRESPIGEAVHQAAKIVLTNYLQRPSITMFFETNSREISSQPFGHQFRAPISCAISVASTGSGSRLPTYSIGQDAANRHRCRPSASIRGEKAIVCAAEAIAAGRKQSRRTVRRMGEYLGWRWTDCIDARPRRPLYVRWLEASHPDLGPPPAHRSSGCPAPVGRDRHGHAHPTGYKTTGGTSLFKIEALGHRAPSHAQKKVAQRENSSDETQATRR